MSTINGRTIEEVLRMLRAKKKTSRDKNGKPYFSIGEYFQIFDSTVGVANYNVDYSDYSFTRTESGQELYSVKCRISILDDEGKVVLYRECYGGYVVQHEKNTGMDVNLQNSAEFVCNTAFKNAAKKFGVFGKYEDGTVSSEGDAPVKPAADKEPRKDAFINVFSQGAFAKVGERDGRPVYTLSARLICGDRMEEAVSNIVFYPNWYGKCSDELNRCITACSQKQYRLRLKVSSLNERDGVKQFMFKGFNKAA